MNYYVDIKAALGGDGSEKYPFRSIQQAADIALPGDVVTVLPGIYREHVYPVHAGEEGKPIVYCSAEPLKAVITGAESVKNWVKLEGNVWKAEIDNAVFGDYNPYTTNVSGDWLIPDFSHTGDVYLNHKSLYEVETLDEVKNPQRSKVCWDPDFSVYTWYTEQDEEKNVTVLYANFRGADPNKEDVEISVRQNCFMPKENGIGYITLSGFTVREAATQWAPPTAYQDGMIGPHWSKGWVIEDCEIYESKCSGISLGKYLQPNNNNKWLHKKYKDGTQTERDCILQASYEGWDKEHIGSHRVRRCNIHDCGQTGIVGHLGGVFSIIENNHIHHINNKQNLKGAEIGGIKMHAAIDCIYRHNHIHHCTRGIWLDWQAQGTRVTGNYFHDNTVPIINEKTSMEEFAVLFKSSSIGEDLFIEVAHGPTLVDNNIMLSIRSVKLPTQGCAFVHNLFGGSITAVGTGTDNNDGVRSCRYTPYHEHHGTKVEGFMTILHGDNRFYNNIFMQRPMLPCIMAMHNNRKNMPEGMLSWDDMNYAVGTETFSEYPTFEEWDAQFEGYVGMGSDTPHVHRYYGHLPCWYGGNVYLGGAVPSAKDTGAFVDEKSEVKFLIKENNGEVKIRTNLMEIIPDRAKLISSDVLGYAFEPEQRFEAPDGSAIIFNEDIAGNRRAKINAGPFTSDSIELDYSL
ncbi:MAG: right-handed parallel beta-helix repeat-containing protein [Clostridia bacterium]|nr:right-handed parallel beta-helix repeat-containing protein [Clostridia bacterium]